MYYYVFYLRPHRSTRENQSIIVRVCVCVCVFVLKDERKKDE